MKRFEQIDISGDVGLRVWGRSLDELFENAGIGTSELITDAARIKEHTHRDILLKSDSTESLLVQWLNELIYIFDAYGFLGKRFKVEIKDNILKAKVTGDDFDPNVNERRLLLKAATYHGLSLKRNDQWEVMVIFDI